MTFNEQPIKQSDASATEDLKAGRKRPKPGERRIQILQALAEMLENPQGERVTTAALAAKIQVSEAALYRHFASKAQMFDGLIVFIEQTIFGLINQIVAKEEMGRSQINEIATMLLAFSERNPGMTRVLLGDSLFQEDARLQERINQVLERVEASLKQSFRIMQTQQNINWTSEDVSQRSGLMMAYVVGRWHRFARSGFTKSPLENSAVSMNILLSA
ncbi:MAG: nucleoid occlusion factor SlmA [Betaproteobacteria bacterium]